MERDTIAAIATPPGEGGIGIIRISGPEAEQILMSLFFPGGQKAKEPPESHRMTWGHLIDGEEIIDECMAVLMRAPRSYTREDVAEIQLHGGTWGLNRALACCLRHGARLAEPGEFTRRAFVNGRIDLSQAEAVMSVISARGDQAHRAAVRQLEGGTAAYIRPLSDRLYDLQAGLAACIDYPEEISDEEGAGALQEGLKELIDKLEDAVDEHTSRLLDQGLQVAFIGRPNVGKSSLLNGLLGEEQAIVTEIPGTTRDLVHGELMLGGARIRLTDTAGIRATDDPVERIGVERSEKAWKDADLPLLVLDGSEPLREEDLRLLESFSGDGAVVINKADLPRRVTPETLSGIRKGLTCLSASTREADGLAALRKYLREKSMVSDRVALTQPRHLAAARRATEHLKDALHTLETCPPDLASTDLQSAQEALSEITGDRVDEALLDRIFASFCVGK